jgi:hypothetical protein
MAREERPDPCIEAGLNVAVAPAGKPLTLRLTAPVNPPEGLMVTP